jgi:hypothetical protein
MWRQFRTIERGEFLLVAVDTCSGGGDYGPAQVLSKTKIDVPLVWHSNVTTADFIPELVRVLNKLYDITGVKPVVAIERNNGGAFLADRLAGLNLQGKFIVFLMPNFGSTENSEAKRYGWDTNTATRPKMLQDLKTAIDRQLITIYDRMTIGECLSFVVMKTSSSWKAQAEVGAHDDLVMALAIVWQMYQICEPEKSVVKDMKNIMAELPKEELFNQEGMY